MPTPLQMTPGKHARGRVAPPNERHLQELSHYLHAARLAALPPATESSWDSWKLGVIPPIKDQMQCGSCWDFSGTRVVETALIRAGLIKADGSQALSEEYTLDCGKNGGCDGDDNTTVLKWAVATGLPFTSDYGPYTAGSGRTGSCHWKAAMPLNKIETWGYCDGNGDGVTDVQDIKNCIKAYNGVGCAVAAGSSWDGYTSGVHTGDSTDVDHDVFLSGWQNTGSKDTAYLAADTHKVTATGWWWMDNSWNASWGIGGRMQIAYGADSIGTSAVFGDAGLAPAPSPVNPWSGLFRASGDVVGALADLIHHYSRESN